MIVCDKCFKEITSYKDPRYNILIKMVDSDNDIVFYEGHLCESCSCDFKAELKKLIKNYELHEGEA